MNLGQTFRTVVGTTRWSTRLSATELAALLFRFSPRLHLKTIPSTCRNSSTVYRNSQKSAAIEAPLSVSRWGGKVLLWHCLPPFHMITLRLDPHPGRWLVKGDASGVRFYRHGQRIVSSLRRLALPAGRVSCGSDHQTVCTLEARISHTALPCVHVLCYKLSVEFEWDESKR